MKWKALFDDGSEKTFSGTQRIDDICKDYVLKLDIKPIFVIINDITYSMLSFITPKKNIYIRIIHQDNPKIMIAATYSISESIIRHLKQKFPKANFLVKEHGKGHFIINIYNALKIKSGLLKYIKSGLLKDLKYSLNTKEERIFNKAKLVLGEKPNFRHAIDLFSFDDLKNFVLVKVETIENKLVLHFTFNLNQKSLFKSQKKIKTFDHRVIGQELGIFFIKGESAPGMPYWLPNGLIIKNAIKEYLRKEQNKQGFQEVETPILGTEELYERSGHLAHYKDDMFELEDNNSKSYLRPMACPHHCDIFNRIPRTHKDLPFKISEFAKLYRKESKGGLIGLERVTSMELSDAHIFCAADDVKNQVRLSLGLIKKVLDNLNVKIHQYTIAIRDYFDNESYGGDVDTWKNAEEQIIQAIKEMNLNWRIIVGEAAFYGPKIDLEVISTHSMNLATISTIQLDFFLPKKFNLTYLDKNKKKKHVVMIHRGLASTFERLIAFMITQNGGFFPLPFSPVQIEIIPISISSKKIISYSNSIYNILVKNGFRTKKNYSEDTLSKKIRNSQKMKRNYIVLIGENEVANKTISIRKYKSKETITIPIKEFLKNLQMELKVFD